MPKYIDADDVLNRIASAKKSLEGKKTFFSDMQRILYDKGLIPLIEAMPAADVAPVVTARFDFIAVNGDYGIWFCTACKGSPRSGMDRRNQRPTERFCPWCGAKIVKEDPDD